METTKVAVIGCGHISGIYFKNLTKIFHNVEVVACSDLDRARACLLYTSYFILQRMAKAERVQPFREGNTNFFERKLI